MKKILLASACVFAFTAVSTMADAGQRRHLRHYSSHHHGWQHQGWQQQNSSRAAHAQWLYGGNPDAGGGPRGSVQSTNSPNASKELGGGR